MKEERRRRRKRRKKTIILGVGDGRRTRQDFLSSKNISRKISLSSLSFCDRIGAEPKKSSQSKRTFLYLRQNTNCIGHTLRRVWGRKRREREKETRASSYLLRRERERESFCRAIHRLSKKRFEQNDYLILSRLTVCACVGFAVEIL
jgi:hypothetical protein